MALTECVAEFSEIHPRLAVAAAVRAGDVGPPHLEPTFSCWYVRTCQSGEHSHNLGSSTTARLPACACQPACSCSRPTINTLGWFSWRRHHPKTRHTITPNSNPRRHYTSLRHLASLSSSLEHHSPPPPCSTPYPIEVLSPDDRPRCRGQVRRPSPSPNATMETAGHEYQRQY